VPKLDATRTQGQTVKGQGYRGRGYTVSAVTGGHTACFGGNVEDGMGVIM